MINSLINLFKYDKYGYDKYGYDREGYDRKGYNKIGLDRSGFNKQGFDKEGYDRQKYNKFGYDKDGFDQNGHNKKGFNRIGNHRETGNSYDSSGYDKDGFDREGFDQDGYDREGFNELGYSKEGYGRDGYNITGFNIAGIHKFTATEYDPAGLNSEGKTKKQVNDELFLNSILDQLDFYGSDDFYEVEDYLRDLILTFNLESNFGTPIAYGNHVMLFNFKTLQVIVFKCDDSTALGKQLTTMHIGSKIKLLNGQMAIIVSQRI